MQEELRLQENKRILAELENKLNCYLSTGTTLAPPVSGQGASAEKLNRDLHGQPVTIRHPHDIHSSHSLSQYQSDCAWTATRAQSRDIWREQPQQHCNKDFAAHSMTQNSKYRDQLQTSMQTSLSKKDLPQIVADPHPYLGDRDKLRPSPQQRYATAPSVDLPNSLKLGTIPTSNSREFIPTFGVVKPQQTGVLFSLKTPAHPRQDTNPSFNSLNTRVVPMSRTPTYFQTHQNIQPTLTRSVLRPAVGKQEGQVAADPDTVKNTVNKPTAADDYNRRKSELDALVQRFEARKKSEVVSVSLPGRSTSVNLRFEKPSLIQNMASSPVPRINLQDSLTEVSHNHLRQERKASTISEMRRNDRQQSVDDRRMGEHSKSSCRTIALNSDTSKTVRESAERIPITRERSRTIDRYLRRKSSTYQLNERSVKTEISEEGPSRQLSVDNQNSLNCRCMNTSSRVLERKAERVFEDNKNSGTQPENTKINKYPPRRLNSEAQDREYREIFNIKAFSDKENQPTQNRQASRLRIEESEKPQAHRLNRTMSSLTNQTFAGLEGSENTTYSRFATDDRLSSAQQKPNSSQLLRDEQFLESLANLLVEKINLKVQQQTVVGRKATVEPHKPTRELPARRELLSTSKFR